MNMTSHEHRDRQVAQMRADFTKIAAADRRRAMAMDGDARLSPTAQRVRGALFALIGSRLALDAQMPDLTSAVEGVDAGNLRRSRKLIADRVRRATDRRLSRDTDLDDLESLLAALEDGEDEANEEDVTEPLGEAKDRRRSARDGEGEHPVVAALRGRVPSDLLDEIRQVCEAYGDQGEAFDRRRKMGRDMPPPFEGRPTPGIGPLYREGEDRRPRRLGQDSFLDLVPSAGRIGVDGVIVKPAIG